MVGSNAQPIYDGSLLAARGLVVVTVNYRLGLEGFSVLEGAPLNLGLADQAAALRWVSEEIAAFGADPGRITIAGQSAGGLTTAALMTSPLTRPLASPVTAVGAGHGVELPFVFDTLNSSEAVGMVGPAAPQALADAMSGVWARFAGGEAPGRIDQPQPRNSATGEWKGAHSFPLSTYSAPGGLRQDAGRAAESPAEARTCGNGSREVRVLLSTYDSRGGVEPLVALAVRLRELGAQVRVCAPPDCAERLAEVGVPMVPVGPPVRPLVHGATLPSVADVPRRAAELIAAQFDKLAAAAEGCDVMRWWRPA